MRGLRVRCPAKINWYLRVLRRRPDGYHEIDTVFQAVDLWDDLELSPAAGLELACDDPELPTDDGNLVIRAARRLRAHAGDSSLGAGMRLAKRIPSRAGLGGGSSDAAGALLGLSRLWNLDLDRGRLAELAAEIGSDTAFFLSGGRARGTGRGERIEPLGFPGSIPVLLATPPFGISTAEVYGLVSDRLTLPVKDVSLRRLATHKVPGGKDFGAIGNDLEVVVFDLWPELVAFRDALLARGATRALLSGSGSSMFGVFETQRAMEEALERLRSEWTGWTLNPSRTVREAVHLAGEC